MPKRVLLVFLALSLILLLADCARGQGQSVQEIKFDLGQNIVETARNSGVPSFQSGDVYGRVDYVVESIPKGIRAHFTREGYEVYAGSLYAFTMYSDKQAFDDLQVYQAVLQISSKEFKSHEAAHAFVMDLMAQFNRGKWKRYFDEHNTRLTGRSSYLGVDGALDVRATGSLDPNYAIPIEDWPTIAEQSAYWRWEGGGVRAKLDVAFSDSGPDKLGLLYRIFLEFELLDNALKNEREGEARRLTEGDAKGWDLTGRKTAWLKERAELNKVLEANAIERGDHVLPGQVDKTL